MAEGRGKENDKRGRELLHCEATLRLCLCSSLDIEATLTRCHEYTRLFIPVKQMGLHRLDFEQNVIRFGCGSF
jgi:hypothetical protein